MLWPLSALSLCFALQVPQHSPLVTIPAVPCMLRAMPATGNGSHRHCHFPALSPAAEAEMQQVCRFCYRAGPGTADKVCTPRRGWVSQNHTFCVPEIPPQSITGFIPAGRGQSLAGVALRVPPGSLLELQGWDQPREGWRAEIAVLSLPQPAFLLERGTTLISLRAEGHARFYSQAKEKKGAILFT